MACCHRYRGRRGGFARLATRVVCENRARKEAGVGRGLSRTRRTRSHPLPVSHTRLYRISIVLLWGGNVSMRSVIGTDVMPLTSDFIGLLLRV